MKYSRFVLIVIGLFTTCYIQSQEVLNVRAKQEVKQVMISYDLRGESGGGNMEIKLYYLREGKEWYELVIGVNGDIGKGVEEGNGKKISWNPLQELTKVIGDGYRFNVSVITKKNDIYGIGIKYDLGWSGEF